MDEQIIPGCARLELVQGVRLLHEEDAVLQGMYRGWTRQMQAKRLTVHYVSDMLDVVQSFERFTGEYPWLWTVGMVDEWSAGLVTERGLAGSTVRNYQSAVRKFCEYLTTPEYGWGSECESRFGSHPSQVCFGWNTAAHVDEYEGKPDRRALARVELQDLLDLADQRVERALALGRKGALVAYRDATVLKVTYAWGLRRRECQMLDTTDFRRNPHAPELGDFGTLHVRFGKGTRGSGPRRRPVATLMPWAVEALKDYIEVARPHFRNAQISRALWLTERGKRIGESTISGSFTELRRELGLGEDITLHSLRHSYVTHLIEDGTDPEFVKEQVGHAYRSTTGIYTNVSSDFANAMMRQALDRLQNMKEQS